jgi:ATP-binding protein involved in chromosome partitioning
MTKSASDQDIRQALAQVRHPEIANTLVELGMLNDITVEGNKVTLTLVLPFMGIPIQIKDYLINSLCQALANVDASLEVEMNIAEMNEQERARFLKMAREGWIG